MTKKKQYQRRKPSKAKRATERDKPVGFRAMLAEFRATHPITGRTAGVDPRKQFRRDFFRVLHSVAIPTDHVRAALGRIDLDPADFIKDVCRQLADKRELTDPRARAGIAESDIESVIDGVISDMLAYLTKHEAECPECFPLPAELGSARPKQAQRILRDHLRRVIDRRGTDPRYQSRRFHDADSLLRVLDDYGAFVDQCRDADFSDAEIDAEAVEILGMVRDAMRDALVNGLPGELAPDRYTLPETIREHRRLLLGAVRPTMVRSVPGAPNDLITVKAAAALVQNDEKTILRAIKGEKTVKVEGTNKRKRQVRDEWKMLKTYRLGARAKHLISKAELGAVFTIRSSSSDNVASPEGPRPRHGRSPN